MELQDKKAKAAELLQTQIEWYEEDRGRLICPAAQLHSKKTGEKDTILYLDGAPTLFCFHESCTDVIEAANAMLRSALRDPMSREGKEESKIKRQEMGQITADCQKVLLKLDWLLENYGWHFSSPQSPAQSWELFLKALWQPEDVLWVGEVWDTGSVKAPPARALRVAMASYRKL